MKTNLLAVLAATALVSATAGFGAGKSTTATNVTVQFLEPEHYTDFRLSENGSRSEQSALSAELEKEITSLAGRYLPPDFHVALRFRDIDMAGDFEPFQPPRLQDVRILRDIYPPRVVVEYVVTNAKGDVVTSGERSLTDIDYQNVIRIGPDNVTKYEADLMRDFFRELGHSLS